MRKNKMQVTLQSTLYNLCSRILVGFKLQNFAVHDCFISQFFSVRHEHNKRSRQNGLMSFAGANYIKRTDFVRNITSPNSHVPGIKEKWLKIT